MGIGKKTLTNRKLDDQIVENRLSISNNREDSRGYIPVITISIGQCARIEKTSGRRRRRPHRTVEICD